MIGSRENTPLVLSWVWEINPGIGSRTMFVQSMCQSRVGYCMDLPSPCSWSKECEEDYFECQEFARDLWNWFKGLGKENKEQVPSWKRLKSFRSLLQEGFWEIEKQRVPTDIKASRKLERSWDGCPVVFYGFEGRFFCGTEKAKSVIWGMVALKGSRPLDRHQFSKTFHLLA